MFKNIIKNTYLYFFYAFIFCIPFQKRHIFNLDTAKIGSYFNEWQAIAVYVSDILFGLAILFWIINLLLCKIGKISKIDNASKINSADKISKIGKINKIAILFGGLIFLFSLISFLVNYNSYIDINVGWFKIIKLAEFILLFIFVILNINTKKRLIITISTLIASGVFSSILAIIQYLKQQTLGLKILGEPLVLPILQNVAKIVLDNGNVIMRAYGTFPHPNVLAGFLVANLVLTLALILYLCYNYGLNKPKYRLLVIGLCFGLVLEIIAFIFTFSRTAWFALGIAILIFIILLQKQILQTIKNIRQNKFYYPFIIVILAIIFIIISSWPQITSRAAIADQYGDKAVSNRAFYNQISLNIIKTHPIFGIGYNNFTNQMSKFTNQKIDWWQYQPCHNVFLLIMAETGIFTLLAFFGLLFTISYKLLAYSSQFTINSSIFNLAAFSILAGFIIIMFFDHYLMTIQQGQLIFWVVLGIAVTNFKKP